MAHFNQTSHTASGALANGGIRHDLGEIPVPQVTQNEHISHSSAKERPLSRQNTIEEIRRQRRQRNKKEREKNKKMSREEKRAKMAWKMNQKLVDQENKMAKLAVRADKERKRAVDLWRMWYKEKKLRTTSNLIIRQIDRENIKNLKECDEMIGEGTFGRCMKKGYREHIVAVKYFKSNSLSSDVEKEAMMISSFDHPGLPFIFGINVTTKPYILVSEFYGIDGQCVTLGSAAKGKLLLDIPEWARVLEKTSEALSHIHSKGFIHGDLKTDNVVIRSESGLYMPVIIDFGKMKKVSQAKSYNLTLKEKEKYSTKYKHIAPEVVWRGHPKSTASDIYSLGQVISFVCFYHRSTAIQKIAKQCIHGTPEKRPSIVEIISQLHSISK